MNHTTQTGSRSSNKRTISKGMPKSMSSKKLGLKKATSAKALGGFSARNVAAFSSILGVLTAKGKNGKAMKIGQVALIVGGAYLLWTQREKIKTLINSSGVQGFFTKQLDAVRSYGEDMFSHKSSSSDSVLSGAMNEDVGSQAV